MENLELLVKRLCSMVSEQEWLEFKTNNDDPIMIGRDISALANSAVLCERNHSYIIWGITDINHEIVGTTFDPQNVKKGNEEIENWLRGNLSDNASFVFYKIEIDNKKVVILIIDKPVDRTVMFRQVDYIRIGSYTKALNDYPSQKRRLWTLLCNASPEDLIVKDNLESDAVLSLLDYATYYDLMKKALPQSSEGIMHDFLVEDIITKQDNGLYAVTALGALLFAKKIMDFPKISRKAIRIVRYKGISKLEIIKEETGTKGYVSGYEIILKIIETLLPSVEKIGKDGLRRTINAYPSIALREIIANALIHQDFTITGSGPIIEIFENKIEITNPGYPLVDIDRIIDNPPKSRNQKIASLMRRLKLCEELGSGWDKIVISCETAHLPAPKIDLYEENMKVTLFEKVDFKDMSQEDKIRACYLHACLQFVIGEKLSNESLRNRFGLPSTSSASISRLIKKAIAEKLIKVYDPETAPRYLQYVPYWA